MLSEPGVRFSLHALMLSVVRRHDDGILHVILLGIRISSVFYSKTECSVFKTGYISVFR